MGGCIGMGVNGNASDPNRPGARVQVGEQLIGTVKSYSPTKGFGFLLHTNVAGDIWFARESLPVELRQIDLAGNQMIFELTRAPDGKPQGRALRTLEEDAGRTGNTPMPMAGKGFMIRPQGYPG